MKPPGVLEKCTKQNHVGYMQFNSDAGTIRWTGPGQYEDHCLGIEDDSPGKVKFLNQHLHCPTLCAQQHMHFDALTYVHTGRYPCLVVH